MAQGRPMARKTHQLRETSETKVEVRLDLDGGGTSRIRTSIPFLDHMLSLVAKHGFLALEVEARGDTEVDLHHTVEDVGLTLGQALREALGKRDGIRRYGHVTIPMDEALASASIDLCSRPYLVYNIGVPGGRTGGFDIDLGEQFFRALTGTLQATIHLNLHYGSNQHHILEALFKAFGRALAEAASRDPQVKGALSTKGRL
jgi:imidazoleglycerol-phosphate dehydratase